LGLSEEEMTASDLRRSRTESFSASVSIEQDPTGDVAIACSKLQYEVPCSAKALPKDANTDEIPPDAAGEGAR
jgi:hypothetical protein